jgi:hypothetical protein
MKQKENLDYKLTPTPILKGKSAKRFYKEINNGKISKEQEEFLEECLELLHVTKRNYI